MKLSLCLALSSIPLAALTAAPIRTTVDSVRVSYPDVQPVMVNDRVMVPLRGLFEHMSASVEWEEDTQSVAIEHGTDRIRLPLNSYTANINSQSASLDTPAMMVRGRTMVPLRFIGEAMKADVTWVSSSRTVRIETTTGDPMTPVLPGYSVNRINSGTVIPFMLNESLSSNGSSNGDTFRATLDTAAGVAYQGLPAGTILEGHVDLAQAKNDKTPGILGLNFDRVRLPDGQVFNVEGSLIGLDTNSVKLENGRWVAKPGAAKNNLKYVGYGAGAGALVSILGKTNLLTSTIIGSALGFLFGELEKDPGKSRDVNLDTGSKFGVRLTQNLNTRTPNSYSPLSR